MWTGFRIRFGNFLFRGRNRVESKELERYYNTFFNGKEGNHILTDL